MSLLIYGNYSRRVNVHGELVSVPRAISLFSESQGYIVKLHVKPGMIVHKGQPLAEINVSRSTFSGGVSERQRETISTQIKTIEYIIVRLRDNRKVTLDTLITEKKRYEEALRKTSEIVTQAQHGLEVMKHGMESYRDYHRRGLINQDQLTN